MVQVRLILSALVFAASVAAASADPAGSAKRDPEKQAMGAAVIELTERGVQLRTQIFTLQAEIERLRAEAKDRAAALVPDAQKE